MSSGSTAEPRPITEAEMRDNLFSHLHHLKTYWSKKGLDRDDALDGLIFSILVMIDGSSVGMPTMDLVMRPHHDDKSYDQENGDNWVENGQCINGDVMLHDAWHAWKREHGLA